MSSRKMHNVKILDNRGNVIGYSGEGVDGTAGYTAFGKDVVIGGGSIVSVEEVGESHYSPLEYTKLIGVEFVQVQSYEMLTTYEDNIVTNERVCIELESPLGKGMDGVCSFPNNSIGGVDFKEERIVPKEPTTTINTRVRMAIGTAPKKRIDEIVFIDKKAETITTNAVSGDRQTIFIPNASNITIT